MKICEHSIFTLGLLVSFTWFNMVWNQSIEHSPTSKRWFSTWFQIREAVTFQENGKRPGDQWWPGPTKIDAHQKMLVVLEDLCHRKAFDFDWRRKPLGFGDLSSFNANGQTARPNHLEFKSKLQCYREYPIYFPFLGKNLPGSPLSVTDPPHNFHDPVGPGNSVGIGIGVQLVLGSMRPEFVLSQDRRGADAGTGIGWR